MTPLLPQSALAKEPPRRLLASLGSSVTASSLINLKTAKALGLTGPTVAAAAGGSGHRIVDRRRFLQTVSMGLLAAPRAAEAQKPAIPLIGFLGAASRDLPSVVSNLASFHQGLATTGYIEGQNVVGEYRWADGQFDRLPALAVDLVRRRVDLIATIGGTPSALAAKSATSTPRVSR